MKQNSDRRRSIIVDAPAQKRIVLRSAALPLLALALGAFAMLRFSEQAFEQAGEYGEEAPSFGALVCFAIVFIVGASAVAIWLALRQSHRVVGPAHRLQKSIERIRQGDLDFQVVLRDGDELTELSAELNRLIVALRERMPDSEATDSQAVTGAVENSDETDLCPVGSAAECTSITAS